MKAIVKGKLHKLYAFAKKCAEIKN